MNKSQVYTLEEAKIKLERYCAYQERCHQEVRNKLKEMNMIPEATDIIIGHLIEHNFLNEARFASAFVRGKFNIKKWGKNRLVRELKIKDISNTNINIALKELDESAYLQALNQLATKRVDAIKETNIYKKRKKLADYLLYRGWESQLVYDKVKELIP